MILILESRLQLLFRIPKESNRILPPLTDVEGIPVPGALARRERRQGRLPGEDLLGVRRRRCEQLPRRWRLARRSGRVSLLRAVLT